MDWNELENQAGTPSESIRVFGRSCIKTLSARPPSACESEVIRLEQCFHLIAARDLVDEAIRSGAYLVSPGWLQNWRTHLEAMGFAEEQVSGFFQEIAREIVLLDTGINPQAETQLAELQSVTGLAVRRISVGLDQVRLLLQKQVLSWRLQLAQSKLALADQKANAERADNLLAMDMLARLARARDENEAIDGIKELFQILFAPGAIHYLKIINKSALPIGEMPDTVEKALLDLEENYAWTREQRGFLLGIPSGSQLVGKILVDNLAFPKYAKGYLNLALVISHVCGLVIENTRNRNKLLEVEKMASLSIVVAGVAHEINTPLGVSIATASSLKNQLDSLAGRFHERTMTQADLQGYLNNALEGMKLLGSNLGRISLLVDRFKQVAVDGELEQFESCDIVQCLSDVVSSFGNSFEQNNVKLHITPDTPLEIDSPVPDWVSIFRNLFENSLKHGLEGQSEGNIFITMTRQQDALLVDYRDDGKGMDQEALSKLFDPFFSTNLQNGMGLGMHLVYNLVTHRLNGSIQCESHPGKGVACHIEVPL
ncbi:MAG: ATP-binding protein [Candidatus Thiodiazotropha sp.]